MHCDLRALNTVQAKDRNEMPLINSLSYFNYVNLQCSWLCVYVQLAGSHPARYRYHFLVPVLIVYMANATSLVRPYLPFRVVYWAQQFVIEGRY